MPESNLLIHLIAPKDRSKWPPIWEHCYKFWENSNYNIILWDDKNINELLKKDDYEFFKKIDSLEKIFKLDYVRYLILEKFGGAYFDMDMEVKLDFLNFLDPQKIYIIESNYTTDEIVQNSLMISLEKTKSSDLFWNHVKEYSKSKIKNNFEQCKDIYWKLPVGTNIREFVGPIMLTEVYKTYNKDHDIQLLSHLHFNKTTHSLKICIHHQSGVWGTL